MAPGSDAVLAEFDRALRAELSVTPSSEFEARVRQRIDERAARRWKWTPFYTWVTAAASVVVVAGAVAVLNRGPVPAADRSASAPAVVPAPVAPVAPAARVGGIASSAPAVQPSSAPRAGARHMSTPQRTAVSAVASSGQEPEVIVPLHQIVALQRLVRAAAEGRVEMSAEPLQIPSGVPAPLEFDLLVVAPIPIPPPQPGERTTTVNSWS